ncbi:hypothetical protein MW887_011357 [Aspergillus wentii]|nr:hypothetical protein MW887_011357 [Aspergillus wentii]
MQPASPAVSQHTPPQDSPPLEPTLRQHGHDFCGDHPVSGPQLHEGTGDLSEVVPGSAANEGHSPLNSDRSAPSSPFVNRHSPFEEEPFYSTPEKQQEAEFKMMTLSSQPHVSLEAFPNEVLTHILSHLPPPTLSSIALVSRRFHNLVTTPHAWRIAFSRYFPGPFSVENADGLLASNASDILSDRRFFSRLTALASWRSEYILRTRLLRSLSRGKPADFEPHKRHGTVRSASVKNGSAVVTYTSQLLFPVSHVNGTFGNDENGKEPVFIHGAAEQGIASASDPSTVKVGTWGLSDHQMFRHFADLFPGDAEYGLGPGNIVGLPNRMDVSQPYGMVYGEGCPQGRSYFISSAELRGRFLGGAESSSQPQLGIPSLNMITTAVTAVWIAKSSEVLKMTGGLVGMLSGTSSGILTAYALGPHPTYEKRFERGQPTAKWVISPGVPLIAIAVDDNFSPARYNRRRIWATVLNALGEVFYLTDLPRQPDTVTKMNVEELDQLAWKTGRSVRWELAELTRRVARPDPFSREAVDGSYNPRSSSDSMKLDENQLIAETKEIEKFLTFKPKHFRKVCEGWDMRRDMKVDFAGDDGHGAGESIVVIARGIGEDEKASIRRLTRKSLKLNFNSHVSHPDTYPRVAENPPRSIFGGPANAPITPSSGTPESLPLSRASGRLGDPVCSVANTEWHDSNFTFGDRKSVQITTSALDSSTYALLTGDEDPIIAMSGSSTNSSVMSSPLPHVKQSSTNVEIPGQRARYMAIGTATGMVFVWDIRSPTARTSEITSTVSPLRIIHTDSPQVSCVALTSLYLIHGGNDGLVQAWDPLASSTGPIRTLNSRFSSRARRLVQAEASIQGVGNNYFATGAICLDPDPTVLRGMVALGTHLRYWAYSSSAADQYKTSKRRWRRNQKGNNHSHEGQQRYNNSGRGALVDHIEDEKVEMERQRVADEKERAHLSNRFGVDLLGPDVSEDQLLAYAQLLSEESFAGDVVKRGDTVNSSVASTSSNDTIGQNDSLFTVNEASSSSSPYQDTVGDDIAPDIAEAIRLSLLDEGPSSFEASSSIPIKYTKDAQSSPSDHPQSEPDAAESSRQQELDDLEFAIQLSLAEENSREQAEAQEQEEFPALQGMAQSPEKAPGKDKGKGRAL